MEIHFRAHQYEEDDLGGHPQLAELGGEPLGHYQPPAPQAQAGAQHCQQAGEGHRDHILQSHQQEGQGQQDDHLHRVPHMEPFKKPGQHKADEQAEGGSQHDGHRHPCQGGGGEGAVLGHAGEGGEEDDDEHVVHRGASQHHLGDALGGAVALLHQFQHPGYDNGGGHRTHHCPHDGGVQGAHPQQPGGQDHHAQHLKGGGQEAHEDGGPSRPAQIVHIQTQARPGEDDDQSQLPQIGGDIQQAGGEHIEHTGAQQDACQQHAHQGGQPQFGSQGAQHQAQQQHET